MGTTERHPRRLTLGSGAHPSAAGGHFHGQCSGASRQRRRLTARRSEVLRGRRHQRSTAAWLLATLALITVALSACSDAGSSSAPTVAATTTADTPPTRATSTAEAAIAPALTTLIPESIASEANKACAWECLTAYDTFYLGDLIEHGFEIGPPYQDQAQYIKIGEAVCARLSEGFTLPQIFATTSSSSDRQRLEVMAAAAGRTYCKLPRSSPGEETGGARPTAPAGQPCSPLSAAVTSFHQQVQAAFPGGEMPTTGSNAALSALTDVVLEVVDLCGYQVMVDIADQYPDPLYTWLHSTAVSALGEISALPDGLRCAELSMLGLGPKQAVDYWFLWGAPDLMDADRNGVPCETVWPEVARYVPST
ncbi:DUF732 domain-containing protein [Modestobacter italicus]|uniref:DUF732 domain-containing protein n=1 Tax=Modestobacter italicus (strain DSM 44449 / CECT 9708 / BC 501) TaxID=2732864 RepID=UPI0026D66342